MNWFKDFNERQQKEIEFSRIYAGQFRHGTDGHNAKLIITKMCNILDGIQTAYDNWDKDDLQKTRDRFSIALGIEK
jgi:hypothetical protein